MFTDNLFEKILAEPLSKGANRLLAVSGFASSSMVRKHFSEATQDFKLELIIGMTSTFGINRTEHNEFCRLVRSTGAPNSFKCRYTAGGLPVHSKVYTWCDDDAPLFSFCGSANYTELAFLGSQENVMVDIDPAAGHRYYYDVLANTMSCTGRQISRYVLFEDRKALRNIPTQKLASAQSYLLPLVMSRGPNRGRTHNVSGLNWGQRSKRTGNEACIPVPARIAKTHFFPPKRQRFKLITDDGYEFRCVVQQQADKGIASYENHSLLGVYFRNRIGLALGESLISEFVTREHLDQYGRIDVEITQIDDSTYLMDFSV